MNKAVSGNDGSLDNTMMIDELTKREQLSAMADGQLQGDEWRDAVSLACEEKGQATWELYHLVGDVLRSPDLAKPADPAFLLRLRDQLAHEGTPQRPVEPVVGVVAAPGLELAAKLLCSAGRWAVGSRHLQLWPLLVGHRSPRCRVAAKRQEGSWHR